MSNPILNRYAPMWLISIELDSTTRRVSTLDHVTGDLGIQDEAGDSLLDESGEVIGEG